MIDFQRIMFPNIKECEIDNAKIIKESKSIYSMFVDDEKWMTEDISTRVSAKELYSSYELSYGDVLLSGLGFGILPVWISNKTNIKSITVVEKNKSVIDLFNINNRNYSSKIKIINEDMNIFKTNERFDCVFLDHYENEPFDIQIKNMQQVYKNVSNHETFYAWRMEQLYFFIMLNGITNKLIFEKNKWKDFKNFLQIETVPDLIEEQIKDFCSICIFCKTYDDFLTDIHNGII